MRTEAGPMFNGYCLKCNIGQTDVSAGRKNVISRCCKVLNNSFFSQVVKVHFRSSNNGGEYAF